MNDNNYIVIQGWMINQLKLSGNDLLVYAIIYGFSQDDSSSFNGSIQYLADCCNSTRQGIQKNLKRLVDLGYLRKDNYLDNGVMRCNYYTTKLQLGVQQSCTGVYNKVAQGVQQSCTNITNNKTNKKDSISKDISETEKPKKKSLYDKCLDEIESYTDDEELKSALVDYVPVRLANKEKPLLGINQWRGMLKKLSNMQDKVTVVRQSIERGWASFFDVKSDYKGADRYDATQWVCNRGVVVESMTDEDKAELERQVEERRKNGKRTDF